MRLAWFRKYMVEIIAEAEIEKVKKNFLEKKFKYRLRPSAFPQCARAQMSAFIRLMLYVKACAQNS